MFFFSVISYFLRREEKSTLPLFSGEKFQKSLSSPRPSTWRGCNRSYSSLLHFGMLAPSKGRHDYVANATFEFCPHCGLAPSSRT